VVVGVEVVFGQQPLMVLAVEVLVVTENLLLNRLPLEPLLP
jgi:hypothetical protein